MVGQVPCPACGKSFEVPATGTAARAATAVAPEPVAVAAGPAAVSRPAPRPRGARPELLDRLPKPFITSPPMIATGGALVFIYGVVMFGVVSAWKSRPQAEPEPVSHDTVVFAPLWTLQKKGIDSPKITPDSAKKALDSAKKGSDSAKKSPTGKDDNKSKAKTSKPKNKKSQTQKKKQELPTKEKEKDGKPEPTGETAVAKTDTPSSPSATDKAASKAELALNTTSPSTTLTPAPVVTPKLVPQSTGPKPDSWGLLSGFPGDCQFLTDGSALTINVPGALHILSPDLKTRNSPRLLTEAGGDFTAQVHVVGRISPGNSPLDLPGAKKQTSTTQAKKQQNKKQQQPAKVDLTNKFPITFQGSGLLVWQDEDNYLRLERTASFLMVDSKRSNMLLFELCRDGKVVSTDQRPIRETDAMTLRIERKGSEIRCSYSPDEGKTWIEVKRLQNLAFPPVVQVGVSASNVSTKPYAARFENFDLTAK
jgi:regulation of enolase protein 1 (concanavalin A-like superfamily)